MFEFGPDNKKLLWTWSAVAGAVAFLIFMFALGYTFWPALFLGFLIAILVWLLLWIGFFRDQPDVTATQEEPVASEPAAVAEVKAAPSSGTEKKAAVGMMGEAGEKLRHDAGKPAGLDGPRDGGADDLKMIKGVGPKLEQMLNGMGFYHFDQIAGWSASEVAWVDENLPGFKGRVSRDNWIDQAKTLAAGGETDFSKRVEDGGVY